MVSSSAPQGFCGEAGLGCGRDTSLIQLPQRTSLSQLRVSGSCVHQTDCVISAWCRDTSYESYCVSNGEHGHCPAPHCVMSTSLTQEATTATTVTPSTSSPRGVSAAPGQCDIEVKSGDYCFKFWEEGIDSLTCDGVIHCVRGNDATYGCKLVLVAHPLRSHRRPRPQPRRLRLQHLHPYQRSPLRRPHQRSPRQHHHQLIAPGRASGHGGPWT
jgi:hypothetical protein